MVTLTARAALTATQRGKFLSGIVAQNISKLISFDTIQDNIMNRLEAYMSRMIQATLETTTTTNLRRSNCQEKLTSKGSRLSRGITRRASSCDPHRGKTSNKMKTPQNISKCD